VGGDDPQLLDKLLVGVCDDPRLYDGPVGEPDMRWSCPGDVDVFHFGVLQ
jgi:hypothetical protein